MGTTNLFISKPDEIRVLKTYPGEGAVSIYLSENITLGGTREAIEALRDALTAHYRAADQFGIKA